MHTSCYLLQTTILSTHDAYLKLFTYHYGIITIFQKRYNTSTKTSNKLDYLYCYDILLTHKKQYYNLSDIAIKPHQYSVNKTYNYIHTRLLLQQYLARYIPENVVCQDIYMLFEEVLYTDYTPTNRSLECVMLAHILHYLHPQEYFHSDKKMCLMYHFCCRNSYKTCQMYEYRASDDEWNKLFMILLERLK